MTKTEIDNILSDDPDNTYEQIHEVHYDKNGEIYGWTLEGISVYGETHEELLKSYLMMGNAFKKPILVQDGMSLKEGD